MRCPTTSLAVVLALAMPATAAQAASEQAKERALRACVNDERGERGLKSLRRSRVLDRAAERHADDMKRRNFFGHFTPGGASPQDRVNRAGGGFRATENLAAGRSTVAATCASWMRSPGHRRNILRRGNDAVGAGYATGGSLRHWYVQVLGNRR